MISETRPTETSNLAPKTTKSSVKRGCGLGLDKICNVWNRIKCQAPRCGEHTGLATVAITYFAISLGAGIGSTVMAFTIKPDSPLKMLGYGLTMSTTMCFSLGVYAVNKLANYANSVSRFSQV